MNNTGTYAWDKELNQLVKISNKIPFVCPDVTFKGSEEVLEIDDKPIIVRTKKQKREELLKRNLTEVLPGESIRRPKPKKDWSKLTQILERL